MSWLKTTLLRRRRLLFVLAVAVTALVAAFLVAPVVYLSSSRPVDALTLEAAAGYELHASYVEGSSSEGPWIVLVHVNRASGQQHRLWRQPAEASKLCE